MILSEHLSGQIERSWLPATATVVAVLALSVATGAVLGIADVAADAPQARPVIEAIIASASVFAALVIWEFGAVASPRLAWTAAALAALAVGALALGVLPPLIQHPADADRGSVASWVFARTLVTALLVMAFVPTRPLRPPLIALGVASSAALAAAVALRLEGVGLGGADGDLAAGYWLVACIPLALAVAAAVAAAVRASDEGLSRWIVGAMVLLAASQANATFQPTAYSSNLSAADALRLAVALTLAVGGVFELRRVAAERAQLLDQERRRGDELQFLADSRSDFPAIVAHELASPLAIIRGMSGVLTSPSLGERERTQALALIEAEATVLSALSADMKAAAARGDMFPVRLRPVDVGSLVATLDEFGRSLPGAHPVTTDVAEPVTALADRERLGQVLRNLVTNAAKYSDAGAPIAIEIAPAGDRVRVAVRDRGIGVHPDDNDRIFEKYGRGRDQAVRPAPGVGLGLYVARRIVRAHGSELEVAPNDDGPGSTFSFTLEVAP